MYAIFKTGGKQYRATTGDVIKVEKLDAEKGATVELDQVLMIGEGEDVKVGTPYLEGGKVTATVVDHGRREWATFGSALPAPAIAALGYQASIAPMSQAPRGRSVPARSIRMSSP